MDGFIPVTLHSFIPCFPNFFRLPISPALTKGNPTIVFERPAIQQLRMGEGRRTFVNEGRNLKMETERGIDKKARTKSVTTTKRKARDAGNQGKGRRSRGRKETKAQCKSSCLRKQQDNGERTTRSWLSSPTEARSATCWNSVCNCCDASEWMSSGIRSMWREVERVEERRSQPAALSCLASVSARAITLSPGPGGSTTAWIHGKCNETDDEDDVADDEEAARKSWGKDVAATHHQKRNDQSQLQC